MGKKLLLIGGGGHCKSVLDSVLALHAYNEIGIVDYTNVPVNGVPVIGQDGDLPNLHKEGWTDAFITVGSIGDTMLRRRLYKMISDIGFAVPTIADSSAIVAQDVVLASGCYVGKGAILNAGSSIGKAAIINTGAVIEHDCVIGEFAHISPGAVLCGQVFVGDNSHIGAGAIIRQQIKIGEDVLVGIGSVVVNDIPNRVKAYGNPCRVVE